MEIKEIKNSPGYFITENGEVYNSKNIKLKTFFKKDGYERIRLTSLKHKGKRVNRSIHLLVACEFLNIGKYYHDTNKQINHIDGNKKNNHKQNLEEITGTENVNHAHNNGLYTYNLKIKVLDTWTRDKHIFRSLREMSRFLGLSKNYIRPRLVISRKYPLLNRYVAFIDFKNYVKYISKIKNTKHFYVYDHMDNKEYILTSYAQISILFGLSYINIGRFLRKNKSKSLYIGGYSITNKKIDNFKTNKTKKDVERDRDVVWKKLAMNKARGPEWVGSNPLNRKGKLL